MYILRGKGSSIRPLWSREDRVGKHCEEQHDPLKVETSSRANPFEILDSAYNFLKLQLVGGVVSLGFADGQKENSQRGDPGWCLQIVV